MGPSQVVVHLRGRMDDVTTEVKNKCMSVFGTTREYHIARGMKELWLERSETHMNFEQITRILKSLGRGKPTLEEKKNTERKVSLLLPHIYKECERNYIHFSCILHNLHKLRDHFTKEYKEEVYMKMEDLFLGNINVFSIKEMTIILKCLVEERKMKCDKMVQFCAYKFMHVLCMDILHKMRKEPSFGVSFLSVLCTHFKGCIETYFFSDVGNTNREDEMDHFYQTVRNFGRSADYGVFASCPESGSPRYGCNLFNMHDVSTFMVFLAKCKSACCPMYTFLSHVYVSVSFLQGMPHPIHGELEHHFLKFDRGPKFCFSRGSYSRGTVLAEEHMEEVEEEGAREEPDEVGDGRNDLASVSRGEIMQCISRLLRSEGLFNSTADLPVHKRRDKESKIMRENVHSMAVIIHSSIKSKERNVFTYVLANYLLLKCTHFLNLIDICNIFELFILDRTTAVGGNVYDSVFGKIRRLIMTEVNCKTMAIFCISSARLREEVRGPFVDNILALYRIVLQKRRGVCEEYDKSNRRNHKNLSFPFVRENTVIFFNVGNFLSIHKISSLFYLLYLRKFNDFLSALLVHKKRGQFCTSLISIIDIHDLLKTFVSVFKMYEQNDPYDRRRRAEILIHLDKCCEYLVQFLEDICFEKIIPVEEHFSKDAPVAEVETRHLKGIKILNRSCYFFTLLIHMIRKLQIANIINDSNVKLLTEVFISFKGSIRKIYQGKLFSDQSSKCYVHVLNFFFMFDDASAGG
ncbi:conserved Plasmodium protein, unknown function [Plasmodium knowlesi strain H]|uniref:Uncharacterized protein n=3 Tax=Plasmodium knowlesi TaxID=5850 RepID=A0A5K1V980_PLAKH|nr:conserved Plasmodium protein, unknown function [Plasmodium knowlesi strain H]OTN64444.1 Uncharacterized protein PKNOH_S130196400 [Plasmodium knowlesi]CAA9989124.1 conserved Plasmodium protein, unknown function [Plasmodium knowlesi strain H]SBO27341.1 conserved Plasmodium protein, unknown function [Plasmodium knowlesi strain H]SBO28963.1 conserved Plasmodium protein, unknown function [Plasmodium knowlesi strain H]VVS78598.1 conserved Plasmodium protein, unknown function [Plasmodium knowlesi |eukprot:XP_002261471.1 hypothetical protein, conserved in Plasmodium species [Plasmodium knowlesi strain H]